MLYAMLYLNLYDLFDAVLLLPKLHVILFCGGHRSATCSFIQAREMACLQLDGHRAEGLSLSD